MVRVNSRHCASGVHQFSVECSHAMDLREVATRGADHQHHHDQRVHRDRGGEKNNGEKVVQ